MKKVIDFLKSNGYTEDTEKGSEYRSFFKNGLSSIDVNNDEIVFIGDEGDWLHIPLNYYALIGALLHHRELASNYIS
jgi:hypothetical protein